MDRTSHVRLMADYNQWMNQRVYAAAAALPPGVVAADRKAFFGSILGTLNHLVNGDIIWLKRFATHPAGYPALALMAGLPQPAGLNEPRAADLAGLAALRQRLDAAILEFAAQVRDPDLDHVLNWTNSKGVTSNKQFGGVLTHFFNHQTHHRGQVTTLLSQEGIDVGVTDILVLVPEEEA
ncbi:MAG: DinB family protein [Telluria sp.]